MLSATLLLIALTSGAGAGAEYARALNSSALDQAAFDAETYGEKKGLKREADGLRMTLAPGEAESGWKTPQQIRFGGDFTISASLVIKTLPKPAQEDGAAIGLAIAFQDINQPDATLLRIREPKGQEVYRFIDKAAINNAQQQQQQMQMQMQMQQGFGGGAAGKPPKLPRLTVPASGDQIRLQIQREGQIVRFQVIDVATGVSRYLGQAQLQPQDVASVKLFVTNRNGAEPINVLWRDLTVRADRITGLGTIVRTVLGDVVYADPTSIEKNVLVLGGPPKAPPQPPAKPGEAKGAAPTAPATKGAPAAAPAALPANAFAPPPAGAVAAVAVKGVVAGNVKVVMAPAMVAVAQNVQIPASPFAPAPGGPASPAGGPGQPGAPGGPPATPPKPKAKVPMDELESIHFERAPAMSARFSGQPNIDFTMPGLSAKKEEPAKKDETPKKDEAPKKGDTPKKTEVAKKAEVPKKADTPKKAEVAKKAEPAKKKAEVVAKAKAEEKKAPAADDVLAPPPGTTVTKIAKVDPKKNGIRDLNISLFGLRDKAIKQVMITFQTATGPVSWRLDTSDSQDWPVVIERSGVESTAEIYLEPPPGDCFEKDFTVNINYEDGQAGNATAKASTHTDAKLALDPKAPAGTRPDAWVYLTDDEMLYGKLDGIGPETLRFTTRWQDKVEVPLARVAGVHIGLLDRKESRDSFQKRLKSRSTEDVLLAQTKNGEVLAIAGVVEGTDADKLRFRYQDKTRTISLKQVEGVIMAARPESRQPEVLRPTFALADSVAISGEWKDLDTATWKIVTRWGQELHLPAPDVLDVKFRGGKVTFLSDLTPAKVEETPFFGHRLPWRRDVSLLGEPLKINGQSFDRGLAVHSRCTLTYDLLGRYSRFEALLGFDDYSRGKGRVDCRIYADGKEIYTNPDLRADQPPVKLALPVSGAQQLRLHVDFGRGQDTGDRVIWANARLYRQEAAKVSAISDGGPSREMTATSPAGAR
jgi:NPCBM/NEW2 domain/Protein of unknown function (DUF1583)